MRFWAPRPGFPWPKYYTVNPSLIGLSKANLVILFLLKNWPNPYLSIHINTMLGSSSIFWLFVFLISLKQGAFLFNQCGWSLGNQVPFFFFLSLIFFVLCCYTSLGLGPLLIILVRISHFCLVGRLLKTWPILFLDQPWPRCFKLGSR